MVPAGPWSGEEYSFNSRKAVARIPGKRRSGVLVEHEAGDVVLGHLGQLLREDVLALEEPYEALPLPVVGDDARLQRSERRNAYLQLQRRQKK